MGFLIQSTKTELKIFRDNSIQPFFEIPKALVSKRMLESLVQAYDVSEDPSKTPETSEKTAKIPKPAKPAETTTTEEEKEPEEKPEPEETKPTKKRRATK